MQLNSDIIRNTEIIDGVLQPDKSFDVIRRDFIVGGRMAVLYFIDGFIKDEMFEKVMEFLFKIKPEEIKDIKNMEQYMLSFMPYVEVGHESESSNVITGILSGPAAMLIDGIDGALIIDVREYPVRSIEQPEKDRSLRGSRDGFVETLIFNTCMLRRRIRDPRLRMEYLQIGNSSKVDLAVCYMDGIADEKLVKKLKERIKSIDLDGISMTAQAISEKLVPSSFFNPFPKIRFSERPDYTSACILEGKVALFMDTSPSVMLFPTSFADFTKETDDYYFPPLTGSYVRIVRLIISICTVLLTPLTLLLLNNPQWIPDFLEFIKPKTQAQISIFAQFLLLELIVDGLRLASLNTPDSQSNALGIVGGLLLSEFAVNAGWFVPETIIYISFVSIASYSQPSFEMGYAMKFIRMLSLILTQFFGIYGFITGFVAGFLTMAFSKTLSGRSYLYPLIPFNPKDVLKLFVRTPIKK